MTILCRNSLDSWHFTAQLTTVWRNPGGLTRDLPISVRSFSLSAHVRGLAAKLQTLPALGSTSFSDLPSWRASNFRPSAASSARPAHEATTRGYTGRGFRHLHHPPSLLRLGCQDWTICSVCQGGSAPAFAILRRHQYAGACHWRPLPQPTINASCNLHQRPKGLV